MRADDLAPLLAPAGQPPVGFHQGQVLAWNADTGANQINVAGTVLIDVPILNTGEAIALKTGHVVGLLRFNTTYFILGRITIPGASDFAAASVAFARASSSATGFTVNTTQSAKATATIQCPSWADEVLVLATAHATATNGSAGTDFLEVRARVGAGFGQNQAGRAQPGELTHASASRSALDAVTGASFDVSVEVWSDIGSWGADGSNGAHISAIAMFRSIT